MEIYLHIPDRINTSTKRFFVTFFIRLQNIPHLSHLPILVIFTQNESDSLISGGVDVSINLYPAQLGTWTSARANHSQTARPRYSIEESAYFINLPYRNPAYDLITNVFQSHSAKTTSPYAL